MTATITFDTTRNAGQIDPRVFSGFLEHIGRAVYEGVYEPGNPLSDAAGFRTDVLAALRRMRMPLVRYPGGNFVSNYDWKDGIGPADARPVRTDFAWQSLEPNTFGTDEFAAWCRELGTEPMLAVNLGTGSPKAAAELLEYCNVAGGTYWSDLRIVNGSPEPHDIRTWCLGNEMDGPWQAGHVPALEYARRAEQAAKLMKGIDPRIETVVAGSSGNQMATYLEWDREVLEYTWDHVDYISAHRYSRNEAADTPWFLAEGVEIDRIIDEYRALLTYVRGVKKASKRVFLCFDEWNVWYRARTPADRSGDWKMAPHLIEEVYNLEDALVCAQYLNSFIRNADIVKIACLAQIVNVIAPLLTRPDGLLVQSIYWPFVLFAESAKGISLTPAIDGPSYAAGERGGVPALDASAAYREDDGSLAVFIVNRDPSNGVTVRVRAVDRSIVSVASASLLAGPGPTAHNTWEAPDVVRPGGLEAATNAEGGVEITLPPAALGTLTLNTAAR